MFLYIDYKECINTRSAWQLKLKNKNIMSAVIITKNGKILIDGVKDLFPITHIKSKTFTSTIKIVGAIKLER